jgi:hypothetical protein
MHDRPSLSLTSPGEEKPQIHDRPSHSLHPEKKKPKFMIALLTSLREEKTQMHDRPSHLTWRRKNSNA